MASKTNVTTEKKMTVKPNTSVVKSAKQAVKKETVAKVVEKKTADKAVKPEADKKMYAAVNVNVLGLDGKVIGKMSLPGEIFGEKVNKALLAQAVRVYLANQRQGNASTKTRGEVDGSTRKIYRQKGTGRARHGSLRAPIFVKGGIVFGPKPRDFSLSMPQKMKRKALFSALSAKIQDQQLTVMSGLEDMKPKTKAFVALLKSLSMEDKKQKALVITASDLANAKRAGSNIQGINF
ncbi:MAG: 50S ribosomal protein L4, partial [Acidobacteriota bacterium]